MQNCADLEYVDIPAGGADFLVAFLVTSQLAACKTVDERVGSITLACIKQYKNKMWQPSNACTVNTKALRMLFPMPAQQ